MSTQTNSQETCPQCGEPLGEITTTQSGKRLQRCTGGSWNAQTKSVEGCDYVKWLVFEPQELDEKCPKCGSTLVLNMTKMGKKMKKCSTNTWNAEAKKAEGCDYIEWINNSQTESIDEKCPQCDNPLVLFTTASGKRMKKCSTAGWDRATRTPTGCAYIEWLNN